MPATRVLRRLSASLGLSRRSAPFAAPDFKAELARSLLAGNMGEANDILHQVCANPVEIIADSTASPGAAVIAWSCSGGRSQLAFNESAYHVAPKLIFARLADFLPLVWMATARRVNGACYLNLGDEGHTPGLASCANKHDYVLVPDCLFLAMHGYAGLADEFARAAIPYSARTPAAFWRGASTGIRTGDVMDLPRVQLCRLGVTMGAKADIGIANLVNVTEEEARRLAAAQVMGAPTHIEHLDRYQVHIDIDGNSNSWTGLLTKLHSGSPVIKVQSAGGFRQWYYNRLVPWENFVPVKSDMSDLEEALDHLLAHPKEAEAIGRRGQTLARALTYDREVAWGARAAISALKRGG